MELKELEQLFKERSSVRKWQNKPVSEALLRKVIEMGTWAPSGGGRQAYHLYLIMNKEKIAAITDAVQRKADLFASWPEAQEDKETVLNWQKTAGFFGQAPALIAVCVGAYESLADKILKRRSHDPVAEASRKARELASSKTQTAGAVIMQMLLAIHALGLGAVWMTGPVQSKEEIEQIIGVPEGLDFVALIPVGYPAEEPKKPRYKALDELLTIIK